MPDTVNPLLPAAFDLAWASVAVILLALTVLALISLARHAKRLPVAAALVWTLVVLLFPVVGAFTWFAIGRRSVRATESPVPERALH